MTKIVHGLFVGAVCVGLLAGCSKNAITGGLTDAMDSVSSSASGDLLKQGVDGAKKGDAKVAIGYLTSWYALQKDKTAAKQTLQILASDHAQDKAGQIINQALSKLAK